MMYAYINIYLFLEIYMGKTCKKHRKKVGTPSQNGQFWNVQKPFGEKSFYNFFTIFGL